MHNDRCYRVLNPPSLRKSSCAKITVLEINSFINIILQKNIRMAEWIIFFKPETTNASGLDQQQEIRVSIILCLLSNQLWIIFLSSVPSLAPPKVLISLVVVDLSQEKSSHARRNEVLSTTGLDFLRIKWLLAQIHKSIVLVLKLNISWWH